ncbi:MAG: DUF1206 domain-containing protein [Paeniglutamicibacter terrestris]
MGGCYQWLEAPVRWSTEGGKHIKKELEDVAGAAETASNSRAFVIVARAGFAVSGILHVLIGVIAIRLALGESGDAEQSGAIAQLAAQPAGLAMIWIGAAACLGLGLWQVSEMLFGYSNAPTKTRWGKKLSAAGQSIVFLAMALSFGSFGLGNRRDSGESTSDTSAQIMQAPGGAALLLAIGLGIAVTGCVFAVRGIMRSFTKTLNLPSSRPMRRGTLALGILGYTAKGITLVLVGLLFIVATLQAHPEESTGLDGALKALRAQPFGSYVLIFIGVGLGCYGIYLMAKSRLARM